eukprot:14474863-Alexandrium_andersonii.AAC.1
MSSACFARSQPATAPSSLVFRSHSSRGISSPRQGQASYLATNSGAVSMPGQGAATVSNPPLPVL